MEDIYKAPDSDLATGAEHNLKPHWFWRLFFWLHVLMLPLLILGLVFIEGLTFFDYVDLMTFPPILVALYGFSYAKKIGGRLFWRGFSIFYPIWAIFYGIVVAFVLKIPQYGEPATVDGWLILELLFAVPTCYALWFYPRIFNSKEKS